METYNDFDYSAAMNGILHKVKTTSEDEDTELLNKVLDDVKNGFIVTEIEATDLLPGHVAAKNAGALKKAFEIYNTLQAAAWREQKQLNNEQIVVMWLFGKAGLGKSRLAKVIASDLTAENELFFITGSQRDPFQHYAGQHVIIIDEIRPTEGFSYSDLLRMLDPYNTEAMAASRFFDKQLLGDYYIITSPFDPKSFYNGLRTARIDRFDQLERRIQSVYEVTQDHIIPVIFSQEANRYMPSGAPKRKNMWNDKSKFVTPTDATKRELP